MLLVIGASGLLGSRMVARAPEARGTYHSHPLPGDRFFPLDKTDPRAVRDLLGRLRPAAVVDASALTDVERCEREPEASHRLNVAGTRNVVDACRRVRSRLVFVSTDSVFDGTRESYSEADPPHPINVYSTHKLEAERQVASLGPRGAVVRTAVLFGSGGRGKLPFPQWVVERLRGRQPVPAVVDQWSCPTLADHLAEVILALLREPRSGVFHGVGGDCVNRYEFARLTAETFGLDPGPIQPVSSSALNLAAPRPRRLHLRCERTREATGIPPMPLRTALELWRNQMETPRPSKEI